MRRTSAALVALLATTAHAWAQTAEETPLEPEGPNRIERFFRALIPFTLSTAYDVEFTGLDPENDADLLDVLRGASRAVVAQSEDEPSEIALRRRARGDAERMTRALKSEGYFEGQVRAEVVMAGETPLAANGAPDAVEPRDDDAKPLVRFTVEPGPRFTLSRFKIDVSRPAGSRALPETPKPPEGGPARSADILAAENATLDALRASGRPYARRDGRDARADLEADTLAVDTRVSAGPHVTFGATRLDGADRVERDFIEGFFADDKGAPLSPARLRQIERELAATRLFRAAQISIPETPPAEDGPVPLDVRLVEAPARTIGGGLRYNTADGPGARIYWEHRNLLGRAEKFRAEADIALNLQALELDFQKPRYLRPDQKLLAGFDVAHETNESFERLGLDATLGLERQISDAWAVSLGGSLEIAELDEGEGQVLSTLFGLPATLRYDGSDDALDPTTGERMQLSATPWIGRFDEKLVTFAGFEAGGSIYRALDKAKRFILAARTRAEVIVGADLDDIPANLRAFAGGGGSVRGYGPRLIGPLDDDDEPTGGRTALDASLELRIGVTEAIGVVPFIEAGSVEAAPFEVRAQDIRYGAGLGLRYKSPVGPLRLDVAVPLDPRSVDDPFQLYVSIGQAF